MLVAGRKIMTCKIYFLSIVVIFIAIFNECTYFEIAYTISIWIIAETQEKQLVSFKNGPMYKWRKKSMPLAIFLCSLFMLL